MWFIALVAVAVVASSAVLLYFAFLGLLTIPSLQTHVIYLHRITLTWFQDVNDPTQWGFLPNQVTPFVIATDDGERLHAWHILPLGLYHQHADKLAQEATGLATDVTGRHSFQLLRDDPQSLLVLYFHGAAGTLGSGFRPPSYRAIHALAPERIHTVAIDYRGFGKSTGFPTEEGLLNDALSLVKWATKEACIPADRIVVFAQSLGTAVAVSLAHYLASTQSQPCLLGKLVLVAPLASASELAMTYRIAGTIPLLAPLARIRVLYEALQRHLICKWPSKDKLAELLVLLGKHNATQYDITIIHAKDDWDIPWRHSEILFESAVKKMESEGADGIELREQIKKDEAAFTSSSDSDLRVHRSGKGTLRLELMTYGLHDRIMSYPVVSRAVWRAFQSSKRE